MANQKPCFVRPVEIQDDVTYYRTAIDVSGGFSGNIDLTPGVYSSVMAVNHAWKALYDTATSEVIVPKFSIISSPGTGVYPYLLWYFSATSHTVKITFGTELAKIFGDPSQTLDNAYATTYHAPQPPSHCWFPMYTKTNQDRFQPVANDFAKGVITKTGAFVGNATGPSIYELDLEFANEHAYNLFESASTNENWYSLTNLETFIKGSLTAQPSDSTYANPRGFWYVPDWNDLNDSYAVVPEIATRNGINFDLTTTPDLWSFCQFDKNPISRMRAAAPTGLEYYSTGTFTVHTVTGIPTWDVS